MYNNVKRFVREYAAYIYHLQPDKEEAIYRIVFAADRYRISQIEAMKELTKIATGE